MNTMKKLGTDCRISVKSVGGLQRGDRYLEWMEAYLYDGYLFHNRLAYLYNERRALYSAAYPKGCICCNLSYTEYVPQMFKHNLSDELFNKFYFPPAHACYCRLGIRGVIMKGNHIQTLSQKCLGNGMFDTVAYRYVK